MGWAWRKDFGRAVAKPTSWALIGPWSHAVRLMPYGPCTCPRRYLQEAEGEESMDVKLLLQVGWWCASCIDFHLSVAHRQVGVDRETTCHFQVATLPPPSPMQAFRLSLGPGHGLIHCEYSPCACLTLPPAPFPFALPRPSS